MENAVDTVYGPQHTHPHPSWSRDESMVTFASDRTGVTQVYVVECRQDRPGGLSYFFADDRRFNSPSITGLMASGARSPLYFCPLRNTVGVPSTPALSPSA